MAPAAASASAEGVPWSARFDDPYRSVDSGLAEVEHVFIAGNRLAARFAVLRPGDAFAIGETGFGTGLNFLAAWRCFDAAAPPGAVLEFRSVERWPLAGDELRAALAPWPELAEPAAALAAAWPPVAAGGGEAAFAGGRIRLQLLVDDAAAALSRLDTSSIDAWFLDGFAPTKNPAMWSGEVAAQVARASRPGASLATYTAAGWVRRNLAQAGFDVRRQAGFGRKRQMSVGTRRAANEACAPDGARQ